MLDLGEKDGRDYSSSMEDVAKLAGRDVIGCSGGL